VLRTHVRVVLAVAEEDRRSLERAVDVARIDLLDRAGERTREDGEAAVAGRVSADERRGDARTLREAGDDGPLGWDVDRSRAFEGGRHAVDARGEPRFVVGSRGRRRSRIPAASLGLRCEDCDAMSVDGFHEVDDALSGRAAAVTEHERRVCGQRGRTSGEQRLAGVGSRDGVHRPA